MRQAPNSSPGHFTVRVLWRRSAAAVALSAAISTTGLLRRALSTAAALPITENAAAEASSGPATASRPPRQLRLAVVRPDLLDDWIPELNDVDAQKISCMDDVTPVWWHCPHCNEKYQSTVQSRVARGRTACPHCSGFGSAVVDNTSAASEAAPTTITAFASDGDASLNVTHPDAAARWDAERNGGLLPSQVTAWSTRQVWWRPAPHSKSQRSFRRPVFAFVRDAASPDDQAAATAAMEWKLLSSIRDAARVEEAEQLGSMPVTLSAEAMATGAQYDSAVWRNAAEQVDTEQEDETAEALATKDGATTGATAPPPCAMSPADAAAVAFLWKPRTKQFLTTMQKFAGAKKTPSLKHFQHRLPSSEKREAEAEEAEEAEEKEGAAKPVGPAVPFPPREVFSHSFAPFMPRPLSVAAAVRTSHRCADTATTVRETLLNQYCDFVNQQRTKDSSSSTTSSRKAQMPLPLPVLDLHVADGTALADAALQGQTWIDFFRLTKEEVRPKGYIDPSASLYFSNTAAATTTAPSSSAIPTASFPVEHAGGKDTLSSASDGVIASGAELVFAYYPRRPSSPPAWEDDVTESVPPMLAVSTDFATDVDRDAEQVDDANEVEETKRSSVVGQQRRPRRKYNPVFRIEAPFGRADRAGAASADSAAQLAAEYDDEDEDGGLETDAGAALASELRGTSRHGVGGRAPPALDPNSASTTSASLVNAAIAALGSAFHPTPGVDDVMVDFDDVNHRRYNRGVQPTLMRDGGRNSANTAANEGRGGGAQQHQRNFRLSMPQEGLSGQLSWRRLREQENAAKATQMSEGQQQPASQASTPPSALRMDAPRSPRKVARPRRLRKDTTEAAAARPSAADSAA
ncbi:putative mitochondrial hypothetical protein [Leptomonas pyrrhocoris]|uniref:Treble clef zinc finger domain-containing protein n=1 Tax=Leptomonas pyrrhocoris TaxID=157538 RepID=A0A0M9FSY4_LEPPY|nr:putative mitochondrial hypothetical protein [Leptomonas pyrrhocoris]KPA75299.1 putative mitochondrial hypothetical protein [Leptomonas pyrrhocoris]|eukprot:XP_015653738.1 putative mitochondrial hypothetical protein [Leptomonas pyrrhocoris]